jgi:hypothetical protein
MPNQTLIKDVLSKYADCASYQDTGWLESIGFPGRPNEIRFTIAFRTLYQKPLQLKLEWGSESDVLGPGQKNHSLFSVDCDGKRNRYQATIGKLTEYQDPCDALIDCSGPSFSLTTLIPALLLNFPTIGMIGDTQFDVEEVTLEGEDCYFMKTTEPIDYPITLWVSKRTKAIRQATRFVPKNTEEASFVGSMLKSLLEGKEPTGTPEKGGQFSSVENYYFQEIVFDTPVKPLAFDGPPVS